METTELNNQVAIINNSIELFKTAPQILQQNQFRTQKALAVGNSILTQWAAAWNIADEDEKLAALAAADERSNTFLVNCNSALKSEKEVRSSITQMMDEFKKMFTAAENDIDKAKPNTVPSKVQQNRDSYAQESFKIAERKRKEAEAIAAKAKEAIDLKANAEIRLNNKYNDYLLAQKNKITSAFNGATLETIGEVADKIANYLPSLKIEALESFELGLFGKCHNMAEIGAFIAETIKDKHADFSSNYRAELSLLRDELMDKFPSKKSELLEQKRLADEAAAEAEAAKKAEAERQAKIATATAEEKIRLEKEAAAARELEAQRQAEIKAQQDKAVLEQKQREEEEAARMANDAEEAKKRAEQQTEIKKQGEQTMVMFEQEATLAETAAAESKKGYDIEVLHAVGYGQIFTLWFEQQGKNLPLDKLGNTKLDQMKTWCEKFALDTGTKIESKFLRYNDSFKAVNRKK